MSADAALTRVGLMLRERRNELGMSVAAAAEKSGLSTGFISLLENGKTDATVGRLSRLVGAYGLRMGDLFAAREAESKVLNSGDAQSSVVFRSPSEGVSYRFYVPVKGMLPVYVTIEEGMGWAHPSVHGGEEFDYVLKGAVRVYVEPEPVILQVGDSLYIPRRMGHRLENAGDSVAELFCLVAETEDKTR